MVWGHGKDIAKLGGPGKNEFTKCTQRMLVQMKVLTWSVIHMLACDIRRIKIVSQEGVTSRWQKDHVKGRAQPMIQLLIWNFSARHSSHKTH